MSTIITVNKERITRANYSVTLIKSGRQVEKHEVKGGPGDAAAIAINLASKHCGRLIGNEDVLKRVPVEFGGTLE